MQSSWKQAQPLSSSYKATVSALSDLQCWTCSSSPTYTTCRQGEHQQQQFRYVPSTSKHAGQLSSVCWTFELQTEINDLLKLIRLSLLSCQETADVQTFHGAQNQSVDDEDCVKLLKAPEEVCRRTMSTVVSKVRKELSSSTYPLLNDRTLCSRQGIISTIDTLT